MNSKRGTETNKGDAGMKPAPDGFHDLTDRERLAIVTAKRLRSQSDRYEEGLCLGPSVDWVIKATLVDHLLEVKMQPLEPGPLRRRYYQEILSGLVAGLRFVLTPLKETRTRETVRIGRRRQG